MCAFNVTSALVLASIPCESAVVDQIACQQLGLEYQAVQHETLRNPTAMAYLVTTMQQRQPRQLVKMKQYFKFVTLLAPSALYVHGCPCPMTCPFPLTCALIVCKGLWLHI